MKLKNRTILITGASAGIGRQIALQLAKQKTNLLLLGRSAAHLEKVKSESLKNGATTVHTYAFDLTNKSTVTDQLEIIRSNHADLSIVINNAGIWQKVGELDQFNHDEIEAIINTNLTALIKVTNTLLPVLRRQDGAAIINISSKSGVLAQKGQSIYSASKYGIKGFTDVLKLDLKGTTVKVAGIYQGGTNTQMFAKAGNGEFPVETFTDPKDLANVIVFALSRPENIWLDEIHVTR